MYARLRSVRQVDQPKYDSCRNCRARLHRSATYHRPRDQGLCGLKGGLAHRESKCLNGSPQVPSLILLVRICRRYREGTISNLDGVGCPPAVSQRHWGSRQSKFALVAYRSPRPLLASCIRETATHKLLLRLEEMFCDVVLRAWDSSEFDFDGVVKGSRWRSLLTGRYLRMTRSTRSAGKPT